MAKVHSVSEEQNGTNGGNFEEEERGGRSTPVATRPPNGKGQKCRCSMWLVMWSLIVLQIAVLTWLAVVTWKLFSISAIVSQNNGQTFCQDVTCQHDGVCSETSDSYHCNCTVGWEGKHCEHDKDECLSATSPVCGPHSTCVNTIGSYNCYCNPGFVLNGSICTDIDECQTFPCHEFADCINLPGNYSCACKPGYTGDGVSSCKVFLCQSQKDDWALGMSVSDGNWSELVNQCAQPDTFPFPTTTCGNYSNPGQAITKISSHLGYHSWHFKRGYESVGMGTPYTTPLSVTAGRTDGAYQATADSFFVSFWFKAANSSGDESRIAVVAGNPAGNDRASNYLEVYALPEGITVRTAESAPNYTYCAQSRNCGWNANYHSIVTGLDLQTWHHVEMNLTAMPEDYMDQWQYRVDGVYNFLGGAYHQTTRYDNGWDYEYVNRLKFQPRHANHDARFQGFFFDDIHYGVFDSSSPENIIEEYCVSFEE